MLTEPACNGYDVVVIGAGIIGLATAMAVHKSEPHLRIVVLEKESGPAQHQSGHNSGVIHSGIYYRPGSLKARLCVDGGKRMMVYCDSHHIPYETCGKLIVATSAPEIPLLKELLRRGKENGVRDVKWVDADEMRLIEPQVVGIAGLHCAGTAIVDYSRVVGAMSDDLRMAGVGIELNSAVREIQKVDGRLEIQTTRGRMETTTLINCAGLQADRVMRLSGGEPTAQIVPFRGEYYLLRPERRDVVRGLIYPVPDSRFPFLGVHLTRTIDGQVEAGPNAVLALKREGYRWSSLTPRDALETIAHSGFRKLSRRYWRIGLYETYRSLSKRTFTRSVQALVPGIQRADLVVGPAGVRAQAVTRGGALVDDFLIERTPHAFHVLNAPSPGATASLEIGEYVADMVKQARDDLERRSEAGPRDGVGV